jgi:hypothetical protein
MRDVADWLVPGDDQPITEDLNRQFLTHMAELQAAFWRAGPELEITPPLHRYRLLSPWMALADPAAGSQAEIPRLVGLGWDASFGGTPGGRGRRTPRVGPGPAGDGSPRHAADPGARWLEAVQPRLRRPAAHGPARLGDAGSRTRSRRARVVPVRQLPPAPGEQGGLHRALPDGAGSTSRLRPPAGSRPRPWGRTPSSRGSTRDRDRRTRRVRSAGCPRGMMPHTLLDLSSSQQGTLGRSKEICG